MYSSSARGVEKSCVESSRHKSIDSYFVPPFALIRASPAENSTAPEPRPSLEPAATLQHTLVLLADFRLCFPMLAPASTMRAAKAQSAPPLQNPQSPHPHSSSASQPFRARCSCSARSDQLQSPRSIPSAPRDTSVLPGTEFLDCCGTARFQPGRLIGPARHDIRAPHRSADYAFAARPLDCNGAKPDQDSAARQPQNVVPQVAARLAPLEQLRSHFPRSRCFWLLRGCVRTACSCRASSRSA